jgi:pimeloyl-ACP methyl ester carboxylesterase
MKGRFRLVPICALLLALGAGSARGDEFDSGGVKIHYAVRGEGDPVILIHGLASSAKLNWDLPGATAQLAKRFQVITFDNRGHGESDKPTDVGQYGTNMVNDVIRLMDHLHIAKARVAGYSMGGMITMKLLTMHPERVTTAVLGGMGWLKTGSSLQRFWEVTGGRRSGFVPAACMHGIADLAVTEAEVKAIHVPVSIIIGENDICRRLYVEPLHAIRPEWPITIIANTGHISCVASPDFRDQLLYALELR